MGESYSLDIWLEMLFGGPVSRLSKLCLAQRDSDLLSCPLMYSNDIFTMCTVLVVKLNFDLDFGDVTYFLVL
jgi:hypothetical protein